jgi:hypothetical protein
MKTFGTKEAMAKLLAGKKIRRPGWDTSCIFIRDDVLMVRYQNRQEDTYASTMCGPWEDYIEVFDPRTCKNGTIITRDSDWEREIFLGVLPIEGVDRIITKWRCGLFSHSLDTKFTIVE